MPFGSTTVASPGESPNFILVGLPDFERHSLFSYLSIFYFILQRDEERRVIVEFAGFEGKERRKRKR